MDQQHLARQFNPLTPTTRQTTRALQEIQAEQLTGIIVLDNINAVVNNDINNVNMMAVAGGEVDNNSLNALELAYMMRWNVNFDQNLATPLGSLGLLSLGIVRVDFGPGTLGLEHGSFVPCH